MGVIHREVVQYSLKGFREYNLGKILFLPSELDRLSLLPKRGNLFELIILLIKIFWTNTYCKNSNRLDSKILFLFAHDTFRNDLYSQFNSIAGLVEKKDIIVRYKYENIFKKLDLFKGLKILPFVFNWVFSIRSARLSFSQKCTLIKVLVDIKKFDWAVGKLNPKKYSLITVFYDAAPIYNYFVQKFKAYGVKVATLQHGTILANRDGVQNIDFLGIELRNSISDFFLAWNLFTKKEALKSGLLERNIIVLGVSKCIDFEIKEHHDFQRKFGVVLDGRFTEFNNQSLITIANEIAERLKLKFYLKFHPDFLGDEYDDVINFKYCEKKLLGGGKMQDYVESVDFSIVANSTVLVELVFLQHKVFCYSSGNILDKYKNSNCLKFWNATSFFELYEHHDERKDELFNEFVTVADVKQSYSDFFLKFVNVN